MTALEVSSVVFTCRETWHPERIGALAVYCSDGRWGEACDEFCHQRLLIPRYDRWAVSGGPACLVPRDANAEFCRGTWKQLDFLARVHELERIVLITHYGCAFYTDLLQREADACLPFQLEEIGSAADALRDWFSGIDVECYLAMRKGISLSFHKLERGFDSWKEWQTSR